MNREAPPELDDRLAHALAHPTRSAILRLLIGTPGLAPSTLSEKLGIGAARVKYHVEVLTSCGAVEAVKDDGRPGELLIRLAPLSSERKQREGSVSDGLRSDVSEEQLRNLIEIAGDLRASYEDRGA